MSDAGSRWSVFTKPWADLSADALGGLVRRLGSTSVELPVRPGCAVEPEEAADTLSPYAEGLSAHGVRISSVAADPTDSVLAGCRSAGVGLVRVMPRIGDDHVAGVRAWQRKLVHLLPSLERYGVMLGLQPHHGPYVTTAIGMRELLDPMPPDRVGLVWDAGHEGLAGQDPRTSLDATWDRIVLVNLKNAVREPVTISDELGARTGFRHRWVDGADGYADWAVIMHHLAERDWRGPFCLPAEYSGPVEQVPDRVRADLALAQSLFH